jgi:glycosyltransferase involved in cell wall biosynthesis
MTELTKDLKVALVHDFLDQYGGAERVLEVLCEMFPQAPIFTLLYDPERMRGKFANKEIQTSFLQKFPKFLRKRKKWLLPFLPTAPETFNLRDFDLIISSSGAWSKGIVTRLDTVHISYLHSPMRFAWDASEIYLKEREGNEKIGFLARILLNYIRIWDKAAADRPDYLLANSLYTQKRIQKYYGRESTVIYPPVIMKHEAYNTKQENSKPETTNYKLQTTNYFLVVSRLSAYKKIDKIIEAFNKLELPLVIVGEGEEAKNLQAIANKNITFLGFQPEAELQKIYAKARAFVFAAEEDFGMAAAEAMQQGIPVLTLRKGGAQETVLEGKTGEFFEAVSPEVIADTIRKFTEKEKQYDKEIIQQRAAEFSREKFIEKLKAYIADKI